MPTARAAEIILNRRSAQRFDTKFTMSADRFYRLPLMSAAGGKPARTGQEWRGWISAWLREHLVSGYSPGWQQTVPSGEIDAAVAFAEAGTLEPVADLTRFVHHEAT